MGYLGQILHTYVIQYCVATGMQNSDEGLPSIILARRGILVKMLILNSWTAWYIFIKFCILIHLNNIETQVCKTAIRPMSRIFYLVKPSHGFTYLCLYNVKMY